MTVVDDATPLDGAVIDVAARVAWALRMARATAQVPHTGLRALAGRVGASAARLSRVETGRLRDGRLTDAYERALGLPEGSVRAPVDIVCRTFPDVSPPDLDPGRVIDDVRELSRLTERLQAPEQVPGGAWLRWARAMSAPGNIGFPEGPFLDLLVRLVSEFVRSVSYGYPTRYEALALLRCSAYGHLVLEVVRAELGRPHAHGLGDLMSVVGEAPTEDAVDWCLDLLRDGPVPAARVAALALENMGQVGGRRLWVDIAPRLVDAFNASGNGTQQEASAAHLIRLVPREAWTARRVVPGRPLPPLPPVPRVSRAQADTRWRECRDAALDIGEQVGVGEQPMLARLLHDIAFGPWETRAATSYLLLGAVPSLVAPVAGHVARVAQEASHPSVRERAARRLSALLNGHHLQVAEAWLDSDDPVLGRTALAAVGAAGRHVPADALLRALRDPATRGLALGSAGLAGHPVLADLAGSEDHPADVRSAARWWLDHGARVVE
jgi:hypothetical protein